ncbi:MAG: hypothetical protein MRQ07_05800, partial [Candidatus Midichloria sp.]|nr:hypothetical protein [Candidatus Midichloria sp.]
MVLSIYSSSLSTIKKLVGDFYKITLTAQDIYNALLSIVLINSLSIERNMSDVVSFFCVKENYTKEDAEDVEYCYMSDEVK